MSTFESLQTIRVTQRRSDVMQVTMSRPAVFNAFDELMVTELDHVFAELVADEHVRVILLAGEGKHFSAGADLQWMQRASNASFDWNLADARRFAALFARIHTSSKPVVASVQGAALGGGVGLVCACDMAIAADNASFAVSEAKFGILPAVISPYVIKAVGKRQAQYLAMSTTRIKADEALQLGLVQQVVAAEQLDQALEALITQLLASGPQALYEIKQLYAQLPVGQINEAEIELTAQTISRVRGTEEAREGFAAFLAKRPAHWIPNA